VRHPTAGVSPIPASSGKTTRYRLNRYGDRALNRALHHVVTTQERYDAPTRDYFARRAAEGEPAPKSVAAASSAT
jgi:transposase